MAKQIKIGFDKTTARETSSDQILVDVRGNLLRDDKGEYLYTPTNDISTSFLKSQNSMSISINNNYTSKLELGGSLSIEEQFPATSEVSNSLLGIPRASQQQSLLADVSVYGLDENTWEFYRYSSTSQPPEWFTRKNKVYGDRYGPKSKDYADQQAIAIEQFPVPFSYPYGPLWEEQGRYNATLFTNYLRFVEVGNILHDYFLSRGYESYAKKYFLPRDMAEVNGVITSKNIQRADVVYNDDLNTAFSSIENWTMAWMDIRDSLMKNPVDNKILSPSTVNQILNNSGRLYDFGDIRPGYSSGSYYYCQLQSKEAFRYQPGAISGFTFGVKLNTDPSKTENVIEWGCGNDTDQLLFQVRGSSFNIVRRSSVPLTETSLNLNGLTNDEQKIVTVPNPFERGNNNLVSSSGEYVPPKMPIYEAIISSDSFNGDPLDGSGFSGYNISFNEVTMYKIEYSWYGAIGAKFYAYVPVGSGECRWILIHTLIIENTLDQPSLKNPFMHFRYSIYLNDTSSMREPVYLFKYGASYYIDGSDEGSFTFNNYKTRSAKILTSSNSRPLIGFLPKNVIYNKDGIGTPSQKNFYVDNISAGTSVDARVDILECEGCANGYGHFYAPSLLNGQRANTAQYSINELGKLTHVDTNLFFTTKDNGKKIIADGIYSSYISVTETGNVQFADINRRIGESSSNNPISNVTYTQEDIVLFGGEKVSPLNLTFEGRLTGYDDIISSSTPLSKNNIRVHFLNPISRDNLGHFNEFVIGITPKVPVVEVVNPETGDQKLLFDDAELNYEEEIYGEFSSYSARKTAEGIDVGEHDPRYGYMFEPDPRIARPKGQNSGDCSVITFEISDLDFPNVEYRNELIINESVITGNFIVFESNPSLELSNGEIGIYDGNNFISSGISFTTNAEPFVENLVEKYYAEINDFIDLSTSIKNGLTTIAFKIIRCYGRHWDKTKVYNFGINQYYLFISMRDNAGINNIVIEEYDETSSSSHTPDWIVDPQSNISVVNISTTENFNETTGKFEMGGITFQGNNPANFIEKNRLDSIKFDDSIELPLRPANYKSSFYIAAGKTEKLDMNYLFGIDRFKATKGAFNNKSIYFSATAINTGEVGEMNITINGKEQ